MTSLQTRGLKKRSTIFHLKNDLPTSQTTLGFPDKLWFSCSFGFHVIVKKPKNEKVSYFLPNKKVWEYQNPARQQPGCTHNRMPSCKTPEVGTGGCMYTDSQRVVIGIYSRRSLWQRCTRMAKVQLCQRSDSWRARFQQAPKSPDIVQSFRKVSINQHLLLVMM